MYLSSRLIVAFLLLTSVVQAQDDDNQKVEGTLTDIGQGMIEVEIGEGNRKAISFDQTANIRVRGEADQSVLVPGAIVEVGGDVMANTNVIQEPNVSVYLNDRGPELRSSGGAYYSLKADRRSGRIPVVIVGRVVSVDPLRVEAGNSIFSRYYFDDEVDNNGKPTNPIEFPSIGKTFEVSLAEDKPITVELGSNIAQAGPKARVTAFVRRRDEMIQTLFLYRKERIDAKSLGLEEIVKKDSKKRKESSTKSAKSDRPTRERKKLTGKNTPESDESARKNKNSSDRTPANPAEHNFQFGVTMLKAGKTAEADRYFERATKLDSSDAMTKRIQEARTEAEEASKKKPASKE